MIAILFWLLTALASGYAAIFGGRDGKWAASLILTASVLTIPASLYGHRFGRLEVGVFAIDVTLLIGLYVLTLASRRWWPIWMTSFHLVAVVSHLSTSVTTGLVADLYFAAATFWSIPMSICLILGVALDHRAGLPGGRRDEQPRSSRP